MDRCWPLRLWVILDFVNLDIQDLHQQLIKMQSGSWNRPVVLLIFEANEWFVPLDLTMSRNQHSIIYLINNPCDDKARYNADIHSPSIAYFISWANRFHITSALILPTLSSWGNLDEGEKRRRLLCTSQKEKAYKREKRDERLKASFLEALKGTGEKAKDETVQNGNVSKRQRDQINIWGRKKVQEHTGSGRECRSSYPPR